VLPIPCSVFPVPFKAEHHVLTDMSVATLQHLELTAENYESFVSNPKNLLVFGVRSVRR
jgi:hypothetical protein